MTTTASTIALEDGLTVGYRELGAGSPVLLLHGWPASSFIWRHVQSDLAQQHRVIALDLPGFGASDKPTHLRYDFALFERAIDGVLDALGITETGLVVHDLGGPIGVHWALRNPSRVSGLAVLNTLLYPEFSDAVRDFVAALRDPERRDAMTSDDGLAAAMKVGLSDPSMVSDEMIAGVTAPPASTSDRLALAHAGTGLSGSGFTEIAAGMSRLRVPVRAVYGDQDRILPDVAQTMARLLHDVPHAEVTALPGVGHFLQEEAPEQVTAMLSEFFGRDRAGR